MYLYDTIYYLYQTKFNNNKLLKLLKQKYRFLKKVEMQVEYQKYFISKLGPSKPPSVSNLTASIN